MSNPQFRVLALSAAVQHSSTVKGGVPVDGVLTTARAFESFLNEGSASVAGTIPPAPAPTKPAAPEKVEQPPTSAPSQALTVSLEQVVSVVKSLIVANKRDKAVAILKEFGAADIKAVKPADYAAVLQKGNDALAAPVTPKTDDLLG